jgi:hypothetical protein
MEYTVKLRAFILMAITTAAFSLPLHAQSYTFQTILECNNLTTFPYAMNGSGVVAGSARNISGPDSGLIYVNGECETVPEATFYGITDTDLLIGGVDNSKTYELIEPGPKVVALPSYPGAQPGNFGYCCMDTTTGVLAGNYSPGPPGITSGFFYYNGTFTSLPWSDASGSPSYWYQIAAMNNTGVVVGTYNTTYLLGFVYANKKMTLLGFPGATYTYFQGINDYGIIVGYYTQQSTGVTNVFLYNLVTGKWTNLDFPYPYDNMVPVGISNTGVIALQYSPSGGMVIATPPSN